MPPLLTLSWIAAVILAAVPLVWIRQHWGDAPQPPGRTGKPAGMAMLVALFATLCAFVFTGVSVARSVRESRELARSLPVQGQVLSCRVTEHTGAGSRRARAYELTCGVAYRVDGRRFVEPVTAGYPRSRAGYDAWRRANPPGTRIALRRLADDPATLVGFHALVPTTTSASSGARAALSFAGIACALFALARLLAARSARAYDTVRAGAPTLVPG